MCAYIDLGFGTGIQISALFNVCVSYTSLRYIVHLCIYLYFGGGGVGGLWVDVLTKERDTKGIITVYMPPLPVSCWSDLW